MTLANLITTHAAEAAAARDWSAVAELLNAATITVRDSTPLTYARIRREFGDNVRAKVAGTMRAIAASESPLAGEISDAHAVMLNERVGMEISSDERQAVIDQIAAVGGWSAEESSQIKSLGVRKTSLAADARLDPVTADDCKKAMAVAACRAELQKLSAKATAANAWLDTLDLNQSVEAVEAYCDDLLASSDGNPTGGG